LAVLDELRRVLKPGGVTLLAVPFETGSQYRSFNPIEPNHHLFSWNVQTLGNLVVTAGFKVRTTELRKYGYDRFAAKLAVRLKWGEKGFRFLRSLGWILKPLREVTVVAEKAEASGRNDVGREITG
jgi:ubiquinone/menaquinone biosynthesis C-methylase UbiE